MRRKFVCMVLAMCLLWLCWCIPKAQAGELNENGEQANMVPYVRSAPSVHLVEDVQNQNFTTDTSRQTQGRIDVKLDLTQGDWQKIFDGMASLDAGASIVVEFDPPKGAVSYYLMTASPDPDPEIAQSLVNMPDQSWLTLVNKGEGYLQSGFVRQKGGKTYMAPYSTVRCLLFAWKDAQGNLINVAPTGQPACYVEYMHVGVSHTNTTMVEVQDHATIQEKFIELNALNIPENCIAKEPEYDRRSIRYYLDIDRMQQQIDEGKRIPELATRLLVPRNDIVSGRVEWAEGGVANYYRNPDGSLTVIHGPILTEEGRPHDSSWNQQIVVIWETSSQQSIRQYLEIDYQPVTSQKWMDQGGWTPVDQDRIVIASDFDGKYGVCISAQEDGHAHCTFTKGTTKNYDRVMGQALRGAVCVRAPEIPGKNIVAYRSVDSAGASIYEGTSMAQESRSILDARPITAFQDTDPLQKTVMAESVATLRAESIMIGNKVRYGIYYPVIYGRGGEDYAAYLLVDWLDEKNEIVASEYLYYTIEPREKPLGNMGVDAKNLGKDEVQKPTVLDENMQLLYEIPAQEKLSGEGIEAEYLLMNLQDKEGNDVLPSEPVQVLFPYPENVNYGNCAKYQFKVLHYLSDDHQVFEGLSVEPTINGLLFETNSFSPFLLQWSEANAETDASDEPHSSFLEPEYYPDRSDQGNEQPDQGQSAQYFVLCDRLNLRAGASLMAPRIGMLSKAETLTVLDTENEWSKVELVNGLTGYVYSSYLRSCDALGNAYVTARNLNVRQTAGTELVPIGLLPRGTVVRVMNFSKQWCCIEWEGKTAFVSTNYLDFEDEVPNL